MYLIIKLAALDLVFSEALGAECWGVYQLFLNCEPVCMIAMRAAISSVADVQYLVSSVLAASRMDLVRFVAHDAGVEGFFLLTWW